VTDDPNSVADAPTPEDVLHRNRRKITRDMLIRLDAAGWEVNPADTADRLAADLAHMTAKAANARSDADALAARLALWQSNTEGAIADAGDLPGDLTAWSAIRMLTAERDDLAARLAVAEAAHLATYETVSRRADAAEARLAALTDAIGDLSGGWTVREGEMILDRIADAAAVQPFDPKDPTDG
jgi:phage shock protein A